MNVGIFTTSFKPYLWYSGISNIAYTLSKALYTKYDAKVNIFLPNYGGEKPVENYDEFTIERFNTINLNKQHGFYMAPSAMKIYKKRKFDLVHSFHYGYFPATAGFSNAQKSGAPHVFTTAYHPPSNFVNRNLMKIYNKFEGSKILSKSDAVIPFNRNEMSQLSAVASGNYNVIPCPVNQKIFRPKKKKSGKFTVAFVGAMEPWKGPHIAFDIFKEIEAERNDVRFIFVGNGNLKHQREFFNKLKSRAGKNFIFTRNLTVNQLASVYQSADVLAAPTSYESFGYILAESLSCGTPVVSTKVGAVPETVGNGGFLVDYGDWKQMKEKITTLLDSDTLRKKLGNNAIKHSKSFNEDVVVEKIVKTYKKVM